MTEEHEGENADHPQHGPPGPTTSDSPSRRQRITGVARTAAARAGDWARQDSTRQAAAAAGAVIAAAALRAVSEKVTNSQSLDPLTASDPDPQSPLPAGTTSSVPAGRDKRPARRIGSGYPTTPILLRLSSGDAFKEFAHPAIRELVVGVTPTSGLGGWLPFIRWSVWGTDAVVLDLGALTDQWQCPKTEHSTKVPVEMRLTEGANVETRFLDPGQLATGAAPFREQDTVAPPTASQVEMMARAQHGDRMGVINHTRG